MLTLFHAPNSRSTRILTLIEEMGIADKITVHPVDILRQDGSGSVDLENRHPEGKVPALLDGDTLISESGTVMLYLTDLFPDAGLAPKAGTARRGDYLTWLFWYGNVMEPVLVHEAAGLSHPILTATFRGHVEVAARLRTALERGPWLLGDTYSAADLLCHSPYAWFDDATPDDPLIRDWVARCKARPATARVTEAEAKRVQARADLAPSP